MNLLWHHLRTEYRAQRWMLLLLFAYALSIPLLAPAIHYHILNELRVITQALLLILLLVLALCPLILSFSFTPFTGSSAFWLSRPLSRKTLFWSKTLWITIFILTPCAIGIYFWHQHLMLTGRQHAIVFSLIFLTFWSLIAFISVIRSANRTYTAFFICLCLSVSISGVGIFILGLIYRYSTSFRRLIERNETPLLGGILFILLISSIAWFLVALWKKHKFGLSIILMGTALFPIISMIFQVSIITPPANDLHSYSASLIHPNTAFETRKPGELILWNNVLIRGLEKDQIILPTNGTIRWGKTSAHGSPSNIHLISNPNLRDSIRMIDKNSIYQRIATHYPVSTTWEKLGGRNHPSHRNLEIPTNNSRENIGLSFQGIVYRCLQLVSLKCQQGAKQALVNGGIAYIPELSHHENNLNLKLEITRPNTFLRGEPIPNHVRRTYYLHTQPFWIVLFHRPSQHAVLAPAKDSHRWVTDPTQMIQQHNENIEFPVNSLQIALQDKDINQWLAECEIHIHSLQAIGSYNSGTMAQESYQIQPDSKYTQIRPQIAQNKQSLKNITLPDNPNTQELSDYLDSLILLSSLNNAYKETRDKLAKLPTEGLIELAKSIPIHRTIDDLAFHTFNERADELPAETVLAGLRRDTRFTNLCTVKKLEPEATPILIERLRQHRPLHRNALGAINIICRNTSLTPELANDLHWHFVHSNSYQRGMAIALEDYQGYDFLPTIQNTWNLPRNNMEHTRSTLAPFALPLGDKEALRLTLLWFRGQQPKWLREKYLIRLQNVLPRHIPREDSVSWAEQHFTQLHFDPATRKYKLP